MDGVRCERIVGGTWRRAFGDRTLALDGGLPLPRLLGHCNVTTQMLSALLAVNDRTRCFVSCLGYGDWLAVLRRLQEPFARRPMAIA